MRKRIGRMACILATGLLAAPLAQAAGGHHAVEDASILDEGQCKVETWFSRAPARERLLHAGTGCRVGPAELSVSGEYERGTGGSQTGWVVQGKVATEVMNGLSVGASLNAGWMARARPRYQASTLLAILTWMPQERVAVHLNLGRDFVHRGSDEDRGGVALEWTGDSGWSLLGERYREEGTHFMRAGVRKAISEALSIDFSRAQRLRGPSPSNWTVGLTWQFDRP